MLRMCLFVRALRHLPLQLWLMLAVAAPARRSWLSAVLGDLRWLAGLTGVWKCMLGADLASWIALVREDPKGFRKKVVDLCTSPSTSLKAQWAASKAEVALTEPAECPYCAYVARRQGLSLHLATVHLATSSV